MVELRSVLVLLVGLFSASADRPVLPSELRNIRPSDAAKYVVAAKAAKGVVRRAARGRPPPLRSVLGGREEAGLVEERPPGPLPAQEAYVPFQSISNALGPR